MIANDCKLQKSIAKRDCEKWLQMIEIKLIALKKMIAKVDYDSACKWDFKVFQSNCILKSDCILAVMDFFESFYDSTGKSDKHIDRVN